MRAPLDAADGVAQLQLANAPVRLSQRVGNVNASLIEPIAAA